MIWRNFIIELFRKQLNLILLYYRLEFFLYIGKESSIKYERNFIVRNDRNVYEWLWNICNNYSNHQHGFTIRASPVLDVASRSAEQNNDYIDNDSDYYNYNESDNIERQTDNNGIIFIDKQQQQQALPSSSLADASKSFSEKAQETLRPFITTTTTTMKSFFNLFGKLKIS